MIIKTQVLIKKTLPIIDTQTTLTLNDLNITGGTGPEGLPERPTKFVWSYCPKCILKWPRCLCITESDWEDNTNQQTPMPRTSSPYPDDSEKRLEKLEIETDDELDQTDYRERPTNNRRLAKPRHRPTLRRSLPNWLKNDCPTHLRQVLGI